MVRYALLRSLRSFFVFFLFLTVTFFLAQIITPGDYAILAEWGSGQEEVEALRAELGLDLPTGQRYLNWLSNTLQGDLGRSFRHEWKNPDTNKRERVPVSDIVFTVVTLSCAVLGPGMVIAFQFGEWLGKTTAWSKRKFRSGFTTVFGILLYTAFPPLLVFLIASITRPLGIWQPSGGLNIAIWRQYKGTFIEDDPFPLIRLMMLSFVFFAILLSLLNRLLQRGLRRRLPAILYVVGIWLAFWTTTIYGPPVLDLCRLIMPLILIYALLTFGETMLVMQTSMMDTHHEAYVSVARAKGLSERVVRDKHAARNALLPALSRLIVSIPYALSGLVIIEDSLGYKSFMGTTLFDAIRWQDIPLFMGVFIVIGLVAIMERLILDITIAYLDPRIRRASNTPTNLNSSIAMKRTKFRLSLRDRKKKKQTNSQTLSESTETLTIGKYISKVGRQLGQRIRTSLIQAKKSWHIYIKNPLAVLGLVLIIMFAIMAVIHPLLMKTIWSKAVYDPRIGFDGDILVHPSPPSLADGHILGTDTLGRDIFSMLLASTPPTFIVAVAAALSSALIGTLIGAFSAYYHRGVVDNIFQYLGDVFLVMPAPIVMIIIGARYFEEIGPHVFGLIYGCMIGASSIAIVMRSQALKIMIRPFIEASRVAGAGAGRIIFTHLIPHMLPLAAVHMMVAVAGAVISYGFIAFVGVAEFHLNWGAMIYSALTVLKGISSAVPWAQLLAPGLALSLFSAAFYFVSRGLHEVAEPRLRDR